MEGQHLMNRKIKIKGSLLSIDQDQVEVTTEEAEEITVKTTESNNQERPEAKHLLGQPRKTTLTKMTVGKKGVPNRNTRKPERMIDSLVLQTDLLQYSRPHKFKPSNHSKYDGKTEPKQWLRIYS